ncbi:MAG TPA: membrane protein insertase YidC [Candidatus Binatia bacterium]|nr:membrane protein insertase YidC [Candidatus Binatia bacterium]
MDQRRVWLAVGLSLLLLLLYQELVVRRYQQHPHPDEPITMVPPKATDGATPPPTTPGVPPAPAATAGGSIAVPVTGAGTVVVENDVFRAELTLAGGRLSSLRLKDFKETVAKDSPPLDLVGKSPVLPLTFETGPETTDAGVVYTADRTTLTLSGEQEGAVVLSGTTADGRSIQKKFAFRGNSYLFDVSGSGAAPGTGLVLTTVAKEGAAGGQNPGKEVALALANQKLVEHSVDDITKQAVTVDDTQWAGFSAQYFVALALPAEGTVDTLMGTVPTGLQTADNKPERMPIVRLEASAGDGVGPYHVYMGPKERKILVAAGHQLDRALDFGWFWFIALPLLYGLELLHKVTGNYGVDIILLTTIVKLVTIPLTQTSLRSMKAMQKLQPEVTKLRERYKDDQVAMQKELMELYKRNQVNPFSGCLPMVLQIPIFVGLYNALNHAIELRHAPFMLWINDLSSPDRLTIAGVPVPVLTLLMGLSMLVQQRMTPQQGDPMQQRMMMIMPVMFTFMFINFPAGLVLYWLVNNLLSISQQYFMLRGDKVAAPAPSV